MPLFFALTLFLSAFLLFLVQPMIGKMILPRLGGTPAVWNTCMVFFQATLLAGYAYTHSVSTYLKTRTQLLVHSLLLCLPIAILLLQGPFNLGEWAPPTESNPIPAVLLLLAIVVGVPFFVVATSAPLLQKWFASTGHIAGKDPYYLYGASNLGSMLALLCYPLLIEPNFTLRSTGFNLDSQNWFWTAGYALLALMVVACALMVWATPVRAPVASLPSPAPAKPEIVTAVMRKETSIARRVRAVPQVVVAAKRQAVKQAPQPEAMTWWRRLRWIGLAAIPSSAMLGVTTYISTDVAAIPFFWIVPLALYLLSFILVFLRWPVVWSRVPHTVMLILQPFILLALLLQIFRGIVTPLWIPFTFNLAAFFAIAMVCHGELAKDRPPTKHLTEFFLWMSVGGVLGGLFNTLIAPVIFIRPIEYQVMLAVACLLRPTMSSPLPLFPGDTDADARSLGKYGWDVVLGVGLFVVALVLVFGAERVGLSRNLYGVSKSVGFDGNRSQLLAQWGYLLIAAGVPMVLCLTFAGRPLRFALGIGALLLAWGIYDNRVEARGGSVVYSARSFFSPIQVRLVEEEVNGRPVQYRSLIHGGIDHGRQRVDPAHQQDPITYFHPDGPIGNVMRTFTADNYCRAPASIVGLGTVPLGPVLSALAERPYAVVGLGIGTLAAYGRPFQHVTYYEIDPAVRRLSLPPPGEEPIFFYLQGAIDRGVKLDVIMGDGRLSLRKAPRNYFKVLVIDAFSSDAIPVHLMTKEAIKEYLGCLADDGILVFNISNRYVNLAPVLMDLAADLKMVCWQRTDSGGQAERYACDWVILARKVTDFTRLPYAQIGTLAVAANTGLPAAIPWGALNATPRPEWSLLRYGLPPNEWTVPEGTGGRVWTDDYSNLLSILSW